MNRDGIILEQHELQSRRHSLLIRVYAYGQYRIQLMRKDQPDPFAPQGHGAIEREFCTYSSIVASLVMLALARAEEPEALARGWERAWNCEYPGGRIRLDNTPGDGSPPDHDNKAPSVGALLLAVLKRHEPAADCHDAI